MPRDDTKIQTSPSSSLARYLRPERFEEEPAAVGSDLKWQHWRYTFQNFMKEEAPCANDTVKYMLLVNHISPNIFNLVRECTEYESAIKILDNAYEKRRNVILARYNLTSRKQQLGESIAEYSRALTSLAYHCHFRSVTAEQYKNETIRGALIAGLISKRIKERLLEKCTMTLDESLNLAISLESAENTSHIIESSKIPPTSFNAVTETTTQERLQSGSLSAMNSQTNRRRCFFCGGNIHQRIKCPAYNVDCQLCSKRGHLDKVCRSGQIKIQPNAQSAALTPLLLCLNAENLLSSAITAASLSSLCKATIPVTVNDYRADALVDTGSSISFIDDDLAQSMKLKRKPCRQAITLASLNHVSYVNGLCYATIQIYLHVYKNQPLLIVNNLCADIIIGHWLKVESKTGL